MTGTRALAGSAVAILFALTTLAQTSPPAAAPSDSSDGGSDAGDESDDGGGGSLGDAGDAGTPDELDGGASDAASPDPSKDDAGNSGPVEKGWNWRRAPAYTGAECGEADTLCLYVTGEPYEWRSHDDIDELFRPVVGAPRLERMRELVKVQVEAGEDLRVTLFGCPNDPVGELKVVAGLKTGGDLAGVLGQKTGDAGSQNVGDCPGSEYVALGSYQFAGSFAAAARTFRVSYEPPNSHGGQPGVRTFDVEVHAERFFLDVGLMIPVVVGGGRSIVSVPNPSGIGSTIRTRDNHAVLPALALHVFPLGLRRKSISFVADHCGVREDETCRSFLYWKGIRDTLAPIGFHAALDAEAQLGESYTARLYGGLSLAPLNGVVLTTGVALVSLDFLPEGYQSGGAVGDTIILSDLDLRRQLVPRFYFGLSLNYELINTLMNGMNDL